MSLIFFNKTVFIVLLYLSVTLALDSAVKPEGAVNDFSSILSTEAKNKLTLFSEDIFKKTGVAIVFASFDSFNDKSTKHFASEVFNEWGIGGRTKELGIIIVASKKEGDLSIYAGNGLGKIFPRFFVKKIKRSSMTNFILKDRWDEGMYLIYSQLVYQLAAVKNIEPYAFLAFSEDYLLEKEMSFDSSKAWLVLIFPLIIIFIIIFVLPNKTNAKLELKNAFGGTFNSKGFGGFKTWMISGDEYLK